MKFIYSSFALKNKTTVYFDPEFTPADQTADNLCLDMVNSGADGIVITDFSESDEEHNHFMNVLRSCARVTDVPILTGGRVKRLEDIKKYLYAGADHVYVENENIIKEAADRFGKDKIFLYITDIAQLESLSKNISDGLYGLLIDSDYLNISDIHLSQYANVLTDKFRIICTCSSPDAGSIGNMIKNDFVSGVMLMPSDKSSVDFTAIKNSLYSDGIDVHTLKSSVSWSEIKKGPDGLLPVIIQDYRNGEVLMQAYMNEEAFTETIKTGKMTYFSRSRQKLWLKGETSGHFQFVKSLTLDCDRDTLLAKVFQVGSACHTGSRSCFFENISSDMTIKKNPREILESVYATVSDRKIHPKEGSYTNYLFDKGIDKILKKIGEEATEIVIASKNPDSEEIKYEICDFLYHMIVLMVEKGVTFDDITKELANR